MRQGGALLSVQKIIPVIMSGGSGTRLWPLSTAERPKQFHKLGAGRTMIEETVMRFSGRHDGVVFLPPAIIASEAHADLVSSALSACGVTPSAVILEPSGRNTAAAAALAAFLAQEIDPAAHVLLAPADHLVAKADAFVSVIRAATAVLPDRIVTFGIKPTGPETGFGYILQGEPLGEGVNAVAMFVEKPPLPDATRYYNHGGYSWNSGVFLFSPQTMLEEFGIAASDIREGARKALAGARRAGSEIRLDEETFGAVRSEAVDRAVMEHTRRAAQGAGRRTARRGRPMRYRLGGCRVLGGGLAPVGQGCVRQRPRRIGSCRGRLQQPRSHRWRACLDCGPVGSDRRRTWRVHPHRPARPGAGRQKSHSGRRLKRYKRDRADNPGRRPADAVVH